MQLTIDGGMTLDLATTQEIADGFGRVDGRFDALDKCHKPIYRKLSVQTQMPASGPAVLVIPSIPSVGRYWNLLMALVVGSDGHTAIANSAVEVYSGDAATPDMGSQIDFRQTCPASFWWSKQVIWVGSQENVFALVYGPTAGQNLTFTIRLLDFPETAKKAADVPMGVG